MVTGVFYLVIGKKRGSNWRLASPTVYTQKPTIPPGKVAFRFEIEVPQKLFEEFIPSGKIILPEDASIGRPAIEVRVPEDLTITPDVQLILMEYAPATPQEDGP